MKASSDRAGLCFPSATVTWATHRSSRAEARGRDPRIQHHTHLPCGWPLPRELRRRTPRSHRFSTPANSARCTKPVDPPLAICWVGEKKNRYFAISNANHFIISESQHLFLCFFCELPVHNGDYLRISKEVEERTQYLSKLPSKVTEG